MPQRLSNAVVKALKPTGQQFRIADSTVTGLELTVQKSGRKSWSLRYRRRGKQKRHSIGEFPDIGTEKARALARKLYVELADLPERAEHTLDDLFEFYLRVHAKEEKRTWKSDQRDYNRLTPDSWKKQKLDDIRRSDISLRIAEIADENGKGPANKWRALLSKMFNVAIEHEWTERNPVAGTRRYKFEPRTRFLKPDEVQRFFQAIHFLQRETTRHYFLMLFATGQRREAVASMAWSDVDLDQRLWTIPAAKSKGKRPQTIPLSDFALKILLIRHAEKTSGFVFPGPGKTGHLVEPKAALKRLRELSGIPDVTIHDIRRTIGSWATVHGTSLRTVQRLMGHSDSRTTAEHYAHLEVSDVRDAMDNVLGNILGQAGQFGGI